MMKLRFELCNYNIEVVDYEGEETEIELDWNLAMLDVFEEELEICFISSKYEE